MSSDLRTRVEEAQHGLRLAAGGCLGVARSPFALVPDADFIFWSASHRAAAECLERGIDGRSPILLLTGGIGTGKTTLLQHLLSRSRPDLTIGRLPCGAATGDLLVSVLLAFEQQVPQGGAALQLAALRSFCQGELRCGRRCILVVDEAQCASDEDLQLLWQLTNVEDDALQVALSGQIALRTRLESEMHASLVARIGADAHLTPMSAPETAAYVRHRMVRAGGSGEAFTAAALDEVHGIARGVARPTNLICELCLVEARRSGATAVDDGLVREVVAATRNSGTFSGLTGSGRHLAAAAEAPADSRGEEAAVSEPPREPAAGSGADAASVETRRRGKVDAEWTGGPPRAANDGPRAAPLATSAQDQETASEERRAQPPTAESPTAASRSERADAEDVRLLAFNALASLADLPAGAGDASASRRKSASAASQPRPAAEPIAAARTVQGPGKERRARLGGPRGVLAAAALGLCAIGFGYHGLWSAIDGLSSAGGADVPLSSAALAAPRVETSDPQDDPSRAHALGGSPDRIAGRGRITEPRPAPTNAMLTTPSVPTVAAPDATGDDLYRLALDLALVDAETAATTFARAASRGHGRAAYYLGQLYETGDGVPLNLALALEWYTASDLPKADRRLAALAEATAAGAAVPPRLLSAAWTSDMALELVWTSAADGGGVGYVVELFEDPADAPLLIERLPRSALRIEAPERALYWRVTVESAGTAASSSLQRIVEPQASLAGVVAQP